MSIFSTVQAEELRHEVATLKARAERAEYRAETLEREWHVWQKQAEKAEAEVASLREEVKGAEEQRDQSSKSFIYWSVLAEGREAQLIACRTLVTRLDEMETNNEGFPFHGFQGELNAAREALKV